jgi:hypothetical protein
LFAANACRQGRQSEALTHSICRAWRLGALGTPYIQGVKS